MEAVLGTPPPPPVADAGALEAVQLSGTLRQRLEQHRANPRCASCHNRMDPLGLAFEHYDAIGAWRTKDEGQAIDATGKLPDGSTFKNGMELIAVLRENHADAFRKNVARQMLTYALGRKPERYDRPVIRQIQKHMKEHGDTFSSLVLAIVESDPFRKRRNPDQIGIEGLPPEVAFQLQGNPDQQMILKLIPRTKGKKVPQKVSVEVQSLKPLLRAIAGNDNELSLAKHITDKKVYRYPLNVSPGEPVRLFFIKGLIAPGEYSDDFLLPVNPFPETDQNLVQKVASWNQAWNSSLQGPVNPRPGTVYAFDFDVRLVAKEQDTIDVWINIGGAHNKSVFHAGPGFKIKGEGDHRLTRVGRRSADMRGAWAHDISLLVRTHAQTVVGNMSPIRFIRPQLKLSDASAIDLGIVRKGTAKTSGERKILNGQKSARKDHVDKTWNTILYGTGQLIRPDKQRPYIVDTQHIGAELIGKHATLFRLKGKHVSKDGMQLKLMGQDEQPGLEGGANPEHEAFAVEFIGSQKPGAYEAVVRVVTQAGNIGTVSQGKAGQPARGLRFVDIPVRVEVK